MEAPNAFTEEALAFAVNQQMSLLTVEAMERWIGGRYAEKPLTVGVLNAGNVPLAGLQDLLAVVLTGHRYLGAVSSKSPALLPAFVADVRAHDAGLPASFVDVSVLFGTAEAVITTGTDETRAWAAEQAGAAGIPAARRLLRGHRYSVAVVDGRETEDERELLAEDALLHEGYGCRNTALIWAPDDLAPDAYLEAFAHFRSVFPAHPSTPGGLKMQQAFLEAVGQPHAYGDGLEFLLSKGDAEVQRPGHVRWVPYADLEATAAWLREHRGELQLVAAREGLLRDLPAALPLEPLGWAQRPRLDWHPDGVDTVAFLAGLS